MYTEFKLGVTVWSLDTTDNKPCAELFSICSLIAADSPTLSPADLYPQSTPVVIVSKVDPKTFVSLDLSRDLTDQMEVVEISVRCKNGTADAIHAQFKAIRARSEIKTALLRGNLGLSRA